MSEHLISFGGNVVALGYDLDERLSQWDVLRLKMVHGVPKEFTRDEWAYLATFLDRTHLMEVFVQSFGPRADGGTVSALFRARGPIAIWLPNNVTLLGPLALILCSFTNAPIRIKTGSRSNDLCQAFVSYALEHLPQGELRDYLSKQVTERFGRNDPRNQTMAAEASVRIVFGSDATIRAIHSLPHPVQSVGISFADHRSEAWVQTAALDDAAITALIKVFTIYGQAGCTSPRRVVVIDGTRADCEWLRGKMMALWPKQEVAMHISSQNILHRQLAAAAEWDAQTAPRNAAVLGVGSLETGEINGLMSLALVPATAQEAAVALPANIQTVGHCLTDPSAPAWLSLVARTPIKRWVPIREMHHFGAVWDGYNFWRHLFEEVAFHS